MSERLLAMKEVAVKVGLSKSTVYGLLRDGQFPAPVRIGVAVRWRESSIDAWIAALPVEDQAPKGPRNA